MPGFHIEHFGCRAARADGEAISGRLRAAGLAEGEPSAADVVVVNTCSVTAEADRAARAFIRRAHRQNPAGKDRRHRLLRAARARGAGRPGRRGGRRGQQP